MLVSAGQHFYRVFAQGHPDSRSPRAKCIFGPALRLRFHTEHLVNAVDLKTSPAFYAFQSTIYWEDFWLLWALKLWDVLAYNT